MRKPLVLQNNNFRREIEHKVDEISIYLSKQIKINKKMQPGLFSGYAGISLYLFYYSRLIKNNYFEYIAMKYLKKSVAFIEKELNHNFCSGASGICWCIQHLVKEHFIDAENIKVANMFDKYISDYALFDSSINYFDFLHGSIGSAIYLFNRLESDYVRNTEEHIVNILNSSKIIKDNNYTWEYRFGNKYNISLSHGMSSTCIYLTKIYSNEIKKHTTFDLLTKSINYILMQELDSKNKKSIFPTFFKSDKDQFSRLGWCYGDIGIAIALWHYAVLFNDQMLKQKVHDIFLFESDRRDLNTNAVIDVSVCHGTAGLALIFKNMYNYYGTEKFKETAIFWIKQTLLMSKYKDGIVGYKADSRNLSIDLLNGISGIGLVLLTFLFDEDISWDECLLLS